MLLLKNKLVNQQILDIFSYWNSRLEVRKNDKTSRERTLIQFD